MNLSRPLFSAVRVAACMLSLVAAFVLAGCSAYMTPSRRADMKVFSSPSLKKAYTAAPAARFPASVALVRIQGTDDGYDSSFRVRDGHYGIVLGRTVETDRDQERLTRLPGVEGIVRLNRLVLPEALKTDLDLRQAAAKLHADLLLLYTFETNSKSTDFLWLLKVGTLGLFPTDHYTVNSTVSCVVMDTRSGYIYGAIEEDASDAGIANGWFGGMILSSAKKKAERAAFDKALNRLETLWQRVYDKHRR